MAKNCLIYETLCSTKALSAESSKQGKLMTLSGVFGVCGIKNQNSRVYEKSNYGNMVKMLKETIANEGVLGELEHPNSMNINLENVSHKIDSIDIDENGVVTGTITLLDTPKGLIAQKIIEGGGQLYISSRAQGTVHENGSVVLEYLKTYDLVGTPGFKEAKMHLNENQVAECINESLSLENDSTIYYITDDEKINENQEDMENKELLEKIQVLEAKIEKLESRPTVEQIAEGVQNWVINEYSSELEKWITEAIKESREDADSKEISESVKNWVINEYSPMLQNWITEQYSPEVENWIKEEYSQGVQDWIIKEYSPAVEKWIKEEYSQGVQDWIIEHYSPAVDQWVKNEIKESKKTSLDDIDATLSLLESATEKKPRYGKKEIISETQEDEPKYIREMPADARVKWNLASEEVRESIRRRAKVFNFVNEGAIETFWSKINFDEVKPSQTLFEGLEAVQDERERMYRAQLRSFKNRR